MGLGEPRLALELAPRSWAELAQWLAQLKLYMLLHNTLILLHNTLIQLKEVATVPNDPLSSLLPPPTRSFLPTGCSLARGMDPICGNGVVERAEECDDANEMPGDGCTENCTAESHYQCTHNSTSSPSQCTLVLLDLSSDNHTTLDRTTEFFDINTPVFLVDPNTLEFLVYTWVCTAFASVLLTRICNKGSKVYEVLNCYAFRPQNWTHLDIVILQGEGMSISESVSYRKHKFT